MVVRTWPPLERYTSYATERGPGPSAILRHGRHQLRPRGQQMYRVHTRLPKATPFIRGFAAEATSLGDSVK